MRKLADVILGNCINNHMGIKNLDDTQIERAYLLDLAERIGQTRFETGTGEYYELHPVFLSGLSESYLHKQLFRAIHDVLMEKYTIYGPVKCKYFDSPTYDRVDLYQDLDTLSEYIPKKAYLRVVLLVHGWSMMSDEARKLFGYILSDAHVFDLIKLRLVHFCTAENMYDNAIDYDWEDWSK